MATKTQRWSAALMACLVALCTFAAVADEPAGTAGLFRSQHHREDPRFCGAQVCVDFDADGRREIVFASRHTGKLQLLRALDGGVIWSRALAGEQQSVAVYDLDRDGAYEILYTVSGPGRLYVLDSAGRVLNTWDSGDNKLGNSAVILDGDGDGKLDAYLGTRSRELVRLDLTNLTALNRRSGWIQCGCYTTAMDVDHDGRWDLFAGSGDDHAAKGVLHRYDPVSLESVWSYSTGDNASSADAVLADIDGDGAVEIVKSVDNYAGDDAHDAVYAFKTDGTLLWKVAGLAGEDSPNVADVDGDGSVEIVGMTFGSEVYCLDAQGRFKWRRDLRPELDDVAHAYMAPILCDVDGDRELEVLAMTGGGYFTGTGNGQPGAAHGVVFALSAAGEVLDHFDVGGPRYWGHALYCNIDDDPHMELVVSGCGGMDVIETAGFGPSTEVFQRRRNYQRLNVVPWAYEDSYFIYRGRREGVTNLTDNLVLARTDGRFVSRGRFVSELLRLPPDAIFDRLEYAVREPNGTRVTVNILDAMGTPIAKAVAPKTALHVAQSVHLEFVLATDTPQATPVVDSYSLAFRRTE